MNIKAFLELVVKEYVQRLDEADNDERAKRIMRKLLTCKEKDSSNERCWNWREKDLGLERTLQNRGLVYNGYYFFYFIFFYFIFYVEKNVFNTQLLLLKFKILYLQSFLILYLLNFTSLLSLLLPFPPPLLSSPPLLLQVSCLCRLLWVL